ncbi:MAG: haloacid dehalogenase type II [Thermonemataceae bacterium]
MGLTLAIDVYGTLINTSGVYDELVTLVGQQATTFMETWRNKQLEYSFRRGLMQQYQPFSVCTAQALDYCCNKYEVIMSEEQKEILLNTYTRLPAFKDVNKGLSLLKEANYQLYAFSNGSEAAVKTLLKGAQIEQYFIAIVSLEAIKTFKPNPEGYQYFNDKTSTQKENTWLISSNAFDVIGAQAYGMQSAWVQRSKEATLDPWEITPTLTVENLEVLAAALKEVK